MECRNCKNVLKTSFSFCSDCGSKIIRNRLTSKSLIYNFLERFFNLDNTFLRTIWHMIIKPEEVCGGYISGLRKKYINPVSMLAISLTLSGFILFLMKKMAWGSIDFSKINYSQTSSGGAGTEKIMASTMEYGSLLFILYIPILTFASYLFFNKQKYNFAELFITSMYALTTFSIISAIYSIILLLISPQSYIDTALIYSLVMVLFCIYVAYKNSLNSIKSLFWRIPLFLFIFLIGYMGVTFMAMAVLFLTGEISIQDFKPQ